MQHNDKLYTSSTSTKDMNKKVITVDFNLEPKNFNHSMIDYILQIKVVKIRILCAQKGETK